jgi:hypothetical protein
MFVMGITQKVTMFAVSVVALAFSGCMGGGTIGTGVTSLGGGTSSNQALTFLMSLTVKTNNGKPLSNSKIAFSNSAGVYRGITDAQGKVQLTLTMVSGEAFSIVVSSIKGERRTVEFVSPAGRQVVKASLTLTPNGAIELIEAE